MKSANIKLTNEQIQVLRGVLHEYYSNNFPHDQQEQDIVEELEEILGQAEDETIQ